MKPAKIIAVVVTILVAILLTAPLWGGCQVSNTLCNGWCEIKHFNSSFKSTACKGGCAADKMSCLAK